MDTNMKAMLCAATLNNAYTLYLGMKGCICHSDRGAQYTSQLYREKIEEIGIIQSMNSDGGRCHDNARCESMWAKLKEELFYSRNHKSSDFRVDQLKAMLWRYFMSYWSNRRICSSNDGLPPRVKRDRYYAYISMAAQQSALYELNVQTIIDNIIYYYWNIYEWVCDILQRMTFGARSSFYEDFKTYISNINTAETVKKLWLKLHNK